MFYTFKNDDFKIILIFIIILIIIEEVALFISNKFKPHLIDLLKNNSSATATHHSIYCTCSISWQVQDVLGVFSSNLHEKKL